MRRASELAEHGIAFGDPKIDLDKLRAFKGKVVGKLTGGLASMAKMRKVTVVQGAGKFIGKNSIQVEGKKIRYKKKVGSRTRDHKANKNRAIYQSEAVEIRTIKQYSS